MALPPEVCIRGAGIVGRTLALLLARERVRVALVGARRRAERTGRPRLCAQCRLQDAARIPARLARCGARHARARNAGAWRRRRPGAVLRRAAEGRCPGLDRRCAALEQQLSDAVRFQPRIEVVTAPVPAPLTVVCEGRISATREALGVGYEVTRYPQHAIAARLEADEPHDGTARQWFNDKGEVLALLPLGDHAREHSLRRCVVVGRPVSRTGPARAERRRIQRRAARGQPRCAGRPQADQRACRMAAAACHRRPLDAAPSRRLRLGPRG